MFRPDQHLFRAPRSMSIDDLTDQVDAAVMPFRMNLDRELLMLSMSNIISDEARSQVLRNVGSWQSPLEAAQDIWPDEMASSHQFALQVISSGDHLYLILTHDKTYIDVLFGPGKSYVDALLSIDSIEHYPYKNTGYGPNRLDEETQQRRAHEWSSISEIQSNQTLSKFCSRIELDAPRGLLDNLQDELDGRGSEELISRQPEFSKRRRRIINRGLRVMYHLDNRGKYVRSDHETANDHHYLIESTAKWMAEDDDIVGGVAPLTVDMIHGREMHPPISFDWTLFRDTLHQIRQEARDESNRKTLDSQTKTGRLARWMRRGN